VDGREPSICVLLDAPVTLDGRVQRTVRTLSQIGPVLLVTSGGSPQDQALFDDGVEVLATADPVVPALRKWLLLHRQHDQLAEAALSSGRSFDIVWANDYPTLAPARHVARTNRAELIYDSHELWVETVNQLFPSDAPFPKALVFSSIVGLCRAIGNREEPRLARAVDLLITTNESYAGVLRKRFGRDDVHVVLNCPESVRLEPSERIRDAFGLAGTDRIVLYQGMMNPGRGLSQLVSSVHELPEDVRLVLLGHGMLAEPLRRSVEAEGLQERVLIAGPIPQAELHEWTASADLGVLVLDPVNLSKRLALANKIFEYMAAGIPILATDLPENRRIIDQCECGWLIPDWDPAALAGHIARILADPEEMTRRGANGRRWFEERFNWDEESKQLLAALEVLLVRDHQAA